MFDYVDNALYPELKRFPSRHQRDEALVRARRDWPFRRRVSRRTIVIALALYTLSGALHWFFPDPPFSIVIASSVATTLVIVFLIYAASRHARGEIRQCLREELADLGIARGVDGI